nr:NADH dehydrogenase subunit 3 [Pachycrepoideus vindemmiae]
MFMQIFLFIIIMFILVMMMVINMLISKKMFKNREKNSPFECGFDPLSDNRMPFSLSFYLISIIFLIFDVEITLILPMIYNYNLLNYFYLMNMLIILIILLLGLFMEWKEGALNWFK